MTGRTSGNSIKLIVTILMLFSIFTVAGTILSVHFIHIRISDIVKDAQELKDAFSRLQNFIYLGLSSLLMLTILLLFLYTQAKNARPGNAESENVIQALREEIENQSRQINNLTNLYNSAVEYDTVKTEFFSNISHELKTPLAVILGAIQLMEQKKSPVAVERRSSMKQLQTIKQNCYRMLRLINNILDITRIDAGYVKMNLVNCNIVYLAEEITQSVVAYAEQMGICLEFDTETEELVTALDIDKIERILLNLLSNAIKFTPPGGKVSVGITSSNQKVYISVKDSGPGIPEHMQQVIFERFRQINSALTRDYEGSGIGLSIVKSFVNLHNGTIRLHSEVGKGSEFIVELPIKLCEKSSDSTARMQSNQNKMIEAIQIEFSHIYTAASQAAGNGS